MNRIQIKILAVLLSFSIFTTGCTTTQIENLDDIQVDMSQNVEYDFEQDEFIQPEITQYDFVNLDVLSSQSRDINTIMELIVQENEASKEDIPIRDLGQTVETQSSTTSSQTSSTTSSQTSSTTSSETSLTTSSETSSTTSSETSSTTLSETSSTTSSETSSTTSSETISTTSSETSSATSSETSSATSSETSSATSSETSSTTSSETSSTTSNETSSTTSSETSSTTSSQTSSTASSSTTTQNTASNPSEMRGVWISFLEFQSFSGSSQTAFTNKVSSYFDTCKNMGLNTVIVQVRPHGDSIYPSEYYPWSKSVSGTMGVALSYDPLEIMITEAKKRGLSFHAWVNPYRTMTEEEMALIPDTYQVKQWYNSPNRSNYMVKTGSDSRWWLKPSSSEARQLIVNGVVEIVKKYDVDGIHFDDYFYGADPSVYGDTMSQAKQYNSQMVKQTYDAIKQINSTVQFGISPLGSFDANSSLPTSDTGYLATDLKLWCQTSGYIDYVMPQIYWEFAHNTQPFGFVFNKWQDFVTSSSVDLIIGLAPYKDIVKSEINQQINEIQNSYNGDGYCLYRYDFIHNINL